MAFATDTYAGDGSKVEFDLTFDFISRDHVTVTRYGRNSMDTKVLTPVTKNPSTDEFIWESDDKIRVGAAPGNGFTLKIVRNTPDTVQIVEWSDGSYITSEDLNTEAEQFLYLIQELEDEVDQIETEVDSNDDDIKDLEDDIKDIQDQIKDDILPNIGVSEIAAGNNVTISPSNGKGKVTINSVQVDPGVTKITAGTNVTISPSGGTGDVTVNADAAPYTLPPATTSTLGGVIVGDNLTVDGSGKIDAVQADPGVTKIKAGSNVTIDPTGGTGEVTINATQADPGVTKIKAGSNITISPNGGTGEVTINADAASYTLPTASASVLGGIKVGANLTISGSGVLSATGGGGGGSSITFKGTANFTQSAPSNPATGDLWLNDTAGTGAWAGFSGDTVGVNDRAFYNGAEWDRLPGTGDPQVQSDWAQTDSALVDFIKNKPALATVATSGSYNDLSNKPTIPAGQVNADWNANSGVAEILNKPALATVATSGSYNDLSNKPTIPTQVQSDWNESATDSLAYIKNKPTIPGPAPVTSVNGKTGAVTLTASDVGALPSSTSLAFVPLGSWSGISEL